MSAKTTSVKRRGSAITLWRILGLSLGIWISILGSYTIFGIVSDRLRGGKQDECSFGIISNSQFLRWKELAAAKSKIHGAVISENNEPAHKGHVLDRSNNVRFDELSENVVSIEERITIAHAMMRVHHFVLVSVEPKSWSDAEQHGVVSFRYKRFSLLGALFSCIFGCEDRASIHFSVRGNISTRLRPNQFDLTYLAVSPKNSTLPSLPSSGHACPPVPSAEWSKSFLAKLKK